MMQSYVPAWTAWWAASADPDTGNFTPEQIRIWRAGGRNTVLSYLKLGSCERTRRYFRRAPPGLVPSKMR